MSSPEMRDVMRRLALAERGLAQRPIVSQSRRTVSYTVQIYDGNTLSSGQYGIKRVSGTLNEAFASSEATMLAAALGTTIPNGVGRGYLFVDGQQQFSGASPLLVLVGNDVRSGVSCAIAAGEWIKVSATKIRVGAYSGADVYAYRPELI